MKIGQRKSYGDAQRIANKARKQGNKVDVKPLAAGVYGVYSYSK